MDGISIGFANLKERHDNISSLDAMCVEGVTADDHG
jgi:hypothetical protein